MITIASVVGARPQFIKAAVVSRALRQRSDVREILIHTGQHYDTNMSDIFFEEMEIPAPDFHLGIGSGPHGDQTGRMLAALEARFLSDRPDCVLVYGDTNSTLAAALAAAKLHIPIAHVEAGLRSFNRAMPEEINRVLTDHVSTWLYVPTAAAVANLAREGMAGSAVVEVGDVMYDAALFYRERTRGRPIPGGAQSKEYVLCTIHRAENTDDHARLAAIVTGLASVARDVPVVWPIHPRTRAVLAATDMSTEGIKLIDPIGYLEMTVAEAHAALIVTDSGGVQKEAFFHGVGCITLRDQTEWVELVELGWNEVVPPVSADIIYDAITRSVGRERQPVVTSPYGDGQAGENIADHLTASLRVSENSLHSALPR